MHSCSSGMYIKIKRHVEQKMLTTNDENVVLGTWISHRGELNGLEEGHNFSISNCNDFHARWWLLRQGKNIQLPILNVKNFLIHFDDFNVINRFGQHSTLFIQTLLHIQTCFSKLLLTMRCSKRSWPLISSYI